MTTYLAKAHEKFKLIFFFMFVFTFPFLYFDPFGVRHFITINAMFFLLYFLLSMLSIKYSIRLGKVLPIIFPLIFLWFIFSVHAAFSFYDFQPSIEINKTFPQILVMLILIITSLRYDAKALGIVRLALSLSMVLTALLIFKGVGLQAGNEEEYYGGRLYFFGMNPNSLGNIAAFTIINNILYFFEDKKKQKWIQNWMLVLAIFSSFWVLFFTASRGAFLAVGIGISTTILLSRVSFSKKISFIFLTSLLLFPIIINFVDLSLIVNRFSEFSEISSLGGRTRRWIAALEIFSWYPIFGVGNNGYDVLTNLHHGFIGSPHNSFIQVLALGGIFGFCLFILAIATALRLALNAYSKYKSLFPLIVLVFFLIIMSKDGGALNATFNWFIFAVSVGSSLNILTNHTSNK